MTNGDHGEILARLDERTKDLPERLDEMRELAATQGERIASVETDVKATKRLSAMISTAVSGAVSAVAAVFGPAS